LAGVSTAEFWTDLYARGGDGWELGQPAPTLVEFMESTPLPPGRVAAEFEQRDIFTLGRDYANAFDGVWEYTCFCAIDPARRAEYVRTMAVIVRPGGWLLACFYPIRRGGGGPPFPMARSEVRRLFAGPFRIERAGVPLHSVQRRQGQEWMVLFRKTC